MVVFATWMNNFKAMAICIFCSPHSQNVSKSSLQRNLLKNFLSSNFIFFSRVFIHFSSLKFLNRQILKHSIMSSSSFFLLKICFGTKQKIRPELGSVRDILKDYPPDFVPVFLPAYIFYALFMVWISLFCPRFFSL